MVQAPELQHMPGSVDSEDPQGQAMENGYEPGPTAICAYGASTSVVRLQVV